MPYVARRPETYLGTSVGSGQCVPLVQAATGAPRDSTWAKGTLVKGPTDLAKGTAIATFDANGTYGNHTDGSSHAAIYIGQDATGIHVIDQWSHTDKNGVRHVQMAHARTIRFKGYGHAVDDGNQFYVVQ
jgi:hypothetical protein